MNKDIEQNQLLDFKSKILKYIKKLCKVSISAQIMILPIIICNYHKISLVILITNILTSFLVGLIIIFGFLIILISFPFFELAIIFGKIYKILINLLLYITENTAKMPFAKIYVKTPHIIEIIVYYLAIFLSIFFYHKLRERSINAKN